MDIQRYRHDHAWILKQFEALRGLAHGGVREHADEISKLLVTVSARIKLHLATEEDLLYPSLAHSGDPVAAELGERFRAEMHGMSAAFVEFVKSWWTPAQLANDPAGFQQSANVVLKALFDRIKRENTELYPAAERVAERVGTTTH